MTADHRLWPLRLPVRFVAAAALAVGAGVGGAGGLSSAAAEPVGGVAEVVKPSSGAPLGSGGSATDFGLRLPDSAACTRDSTNGGYRINSYLVPRSVALDTLRFDAGGPVAVAGEFRAPLYDDGGSQLTSKLTATELKPGGVGTIVQPVASFRFNVYTPAAEGFPLPPGSYNIGIACTLGPPTSPTQLDRYWNAIIDVTADPADTPANIAWTAAAPPDDQVEGPTRSRASLVPLFVAATAVLGSLFIFRRRSRRVDHRAARSQPHHLKET